MNADELALKFAEIALSIATSTRMRIAPVFILAMILTALVIYLWRRQRIASPSFWAWLFPARIYLHDSHKVDLKLFLFNKTLGLLGLLRAPFLRTAVTGFSFALLCRLTERRMESGPSTQLQLLTTTLLVVLVSDFTTYWVHRFHHRSRVFWPFHAVHHSAEVMTPLTLYRKHPIYDIGSNMFKALSGGLAVALLLFLFQRRFDALTIGSANLIYVAFNALGSNFRHSHIWIGYPPWLERIFVSPAQHQLHHSRELAHRDCNFGEVFAIWDWSFGTLVLSGEERELLIGLGDEQGQAIPQPHTGLLRTLILPLRESWSVLRNRPPELQPQGSTESP